MMAEPNSNIPKGSWVLITGVTGYVASQVAKQFLERGYRVRGTVRDIAAAAWLTDLFELHVTAGNLELVSVPDLAAENAYDIAVQGVSAIIHVASVVAFDNDPNLVITPSVNGTTSILQAALAEPSVRAFVYTSAIVASTAAVPGNNAVVGRNSWNEVAVQRAWTPELGDGIAVYCASKVAAEKALWKFAAEKGPQFTINVVSPASVIGEPLNKRHYYAKTSWIRQLVDGEKIGLEAVGAINCVDIKDIALLHVAAALDPEVKEARLQAWGNRSSWNEMLEVLRKLRPNRDFMTDFPDSRRLSVSTDQSQALALIKKWGNRDGWIPWEESIGENLKFLD